MQLNSKTILLDENTDLSTDGFKANIIEVPPNLGLNEDAVWYWRVLTTFLPITESLRIRLDSFATEADAKSGKNQLEKQFLFTTPSKGGLETSKLTVGKQAWVEISPDLSGGWIRAYTDSKVSGTITAGRLLLGISFGGLEVTEENKLYVDNPALVK